MNTEMAYLLGMILGNGEIQQGPHNTTVTIDIPYKNLYTDDLKDVSIYVKASVVTGEDFPDWYLIPKIDAVSIVGYAVVDNPKNANSYDENLLEKASSEERNDMPEEA